MSGSSKSSDRSSKSARADSEELRILNALYTITRVVDRTEDTSSAIALIVGELIAFFSADAAALALINPDTHALEIEHSIGYPDDTKHAAIPAGVGLLGWAAVQNRSLLVGDLTAEPRHLPLRSDSRAIMVAPLIVDDQLHGVLALESNTAGAFNEQQLQVFIRLTAESAGALRLIWQTNHLRRKAQLLEILGNVAQQLAGKLEPADLMDTVTRESHRLTHCRLATLQIHEASERRIRLQSIHPPGEYFRDGNTEWSIEDCLASSPITTRKQVEFSNVHQPEYHDLHDIPIGPPLIAVLSTPLIADNEVLGVLNVYTDRPHRFANDERRLIKGLANLAAVALQNARLYQRVFKSEENLRQSERLTTLGLLAAEIAHETRNPLTVIRLLFGALNLQFPGDDPRATDVSIIREKLDQLESFVTRVLTFAKAPESLHSRLNLDDIIRETCLLLRLKLNQARIHMHYEPPERTVVVDCNKGQIQQVLLNVILNATHAMPEGGSISIACRVDRDSTPPVVAIEVNDTGTGIPEKHQGRIFDSFLSGRSDGTGLGLSIAKRIMRSHHGDIEVAATSPGGTTMRMTLPLAK